MSRLTAEQRKKLPDSDFAGPNRSYPVEDRRHARAALALLKNAPPSARGKIKAKADAMLKGKGSK